MRGQHHLARDGVRDQAVAVEHHQHLVDEGGEAARGHELAEVAGRRVEGPLRHDEDHVRAARVDVLLVAVAGESVTNKRDRAVIELLYKIEETFNLQIPDQDLAGLTTVGTVASYVEQRLAPPTQAADLAIKKSPAKGKKKK